MSSTLFGAATPSILDASDAIDYSLGTRFTPNVDGTVTHARYYFPTNAQPANQAVIATIYRVSDQAVMGTVSFPSLPTLGTWNQVAFASPVALTAGTAYTISMWLAGRYVATATYGFPFTSGDLSAASQNGWLRSGGGVPAFPDVASGNGASYFADVVFEAGAAQTTVTSDLDLRWQVRGTATSDLDLRWAVRGTVTSDLDLRWGVGGQVSSDLDLRWALLADTPAPAVGRGSWMQLLDTYKLNREYEREREDVACWRCGEPYLTGPHSEIYCPYCGLRPNL